MIYINKILPIIASPLGLIIILLLFGVFRRKMLPLMVASMLLIILSLPIVSNKLTKELEGNYTPIQIQDMKKAETVVVLSGMVEVIKYKDTFYYEFSGAVDRIFAGIHILKSNKAMKIILTRGKLPWAMGKPEGEILSKFVQLRGIEKDRIILTEEVQNTDDEAKAVGKILPKNSTIVLITSAFHMPRAKIVFENQDFNVIPYAVDFKTSSTQLNFLDFFPQAKAFNYSNIFFREMVGRLYYALKY